ncbi:TonB-dependent receptor [Cyclobacterium qasimii]|uniref:TonB-dependent receptor n=2 Tax=Cyclobacterium qasimii TaxID=1350429 RepID=S7V7R1_9BACT|nr:TonB-dependent receptor [Cyclobacterium qasimii]EPR65976.1 TonB-dependent receptor [Cyclobacterium qasimii M12-11B]GEO21851.1 TonB-dependent receptor [Cyclobacterium qasimii]
MRKLLFLLERQLGVLAFLFLCSLFSFAQSSQAATVKGKVLDAGSNPIPGVIVRIKDSSFTSISAVDGSYQISNVPKGNFELLLSSMGYEEHSKTIIIDKEETILQLDFSLIASTTDLEGVVVEGQSVKTEIETTGFAVEVVETKQAALQSIQTNDLLNRTAGIRVRQNGGIGSRVDYNLNGMSGNSVRIFIDGLPVSTYGSSFSLNSIPPAMIERIEVYKGVIPAHLADDALGGAINVILKKGMVNNLSASVSYGSFNTLQSNVSAAYRDENTGFTTKVSAFSNSSDNDYEVWGKFVRNILPNGRYDYVRAKRFNDAYRSIGGKVDFGFTNVKWADQFFVSYTGSDDYNEIQHGTYMSIPYKGRFTTSQSHVLGLTYVKEDFLTKGLDLTFNGSLSKINEVVTDTVKWNYNWFDEISLGFDGEPLLTSGGAQQGAPTINHINRNIATFRAGASYAINENHKVFVGQTFYTLDRDEQDFMKSVIEREFIGTRDLQKSITSLSYELDLFQSRLKGNVFGKYYLQGIEKMDPLLVEENGTSTRIEDRVTRKSDTGGYGAAFSFRVFKPLVLMASAEKAVRMPAEDEIFGSPGENIVQNLGIRPEVSDNLNLGFILGDFEHQSHTFSFTGTGFIRDTQDKIIQQINPRVNDAVQTNAFENLGKTKSIGFEGQLKYAYGDSFRFIANVSKFNSIFNTKYDNNGNVFEKYQQQIPNEPFFTINSSMDYTFKNVLSHGSLLRLSHYFGYVERFYTTWLEIEDFRTPRQYINDIGATYTFPNRKLAVSLDLKNMFDKQVYDNFAVQKPGRAFYVKFNYTIGNFK